MSNVDSKDEVASAESSPFGRRLGRFIAIILILIATLVAVAMFLGKDDQSSLETAPPKKTFQF